MLIDFSFIKMDGTFRQDAKGSCGNGVQDGEWIYQYFVYCSFVNYPFDLCIEFDNCLELPC